MNADILPSKFYLIAVYPDGETELCSCGDSSVELLRVAEHFSKTSDAVYVVAANAVSFFQGKQVTNERRSH